MNKFKDKSIENLEEDIFVETQSSNTSIVDVGNIVKENNKNKFNEIKSNIDIEREKFNH